ncbi:hypothetical protein CANARDRAFT_5467 [[Candida] arabinofermentans NRRL YB-2248]|uniref:Pre-rRNA-processing protein PNO1 n=1 Tax=[Candida] arabinofermentans NRRL YB-2248 TaxID=983967 RepID=A0A1E4T8V3_9ASCO|nr:hypothetical protein CANARDRAFT_5467 [[Candida] arabinofermentans NRRL YB-2248]
MAAPTSIKKTQEIQPTTTPIERDEDEILIDASVPTTDAMDEDPQPSTTSKKSTKPQASLVLDESGKPRFQSQSTSAMKVKLESRKVGIPSHRLSPLKNAWPKIYPPLVDHLKLQVRMNLKTKNVELKTCVKTNDPSALQKGADFIKAFSLGFDIDDAIALLRLDDLYIESFEVKDVKTLQGDHLSRAIGRIAGKDGKTKFAIENATRTRIVLADSKVHILGGYSHIRMARVAVMSLILGSPPGKVYGNLRTVASRLKERY